MDYRCRKYYLIQFNVYSKCDLECQEILKSEFNCKINPPYNHYEYEVIQKITREVSELAPYLSGREKIAQDLEREVDKMKMAEYMKSFIGQEFDGLISDILPKGLYVQLPNLVEGRINLDGHNGKIIFNNETYTLSDLNRGLIYKLGMPVKVKLIEASKERHTIDFELVDDKPKVKELKHGNSKQKG